MVRLTSNHLAREVVVDHLQSIGATILSSANNHPLPSANDHQPEQGESGSGTGNGEGCYISASAPVRVWEDLLATQFFTLPQPQRQRRPQQPQPQQSQPQQQQSRTDSVAEEDEGQELIRCHRYSLPAELVEHVSFVFNTGLISCPPISHTTRTTDTPYARTSQTSYMGTAPTAIALY